MPVRLTDYEVALIYVTARVKYGFDYAPSDQLERERPDCPWLEPIIQRHNGSVDTVEATWSDFRSTLPGHTPTREVTKQVRIMNDLCWLPEGPHLAVAGEQAAALREAERQQRYREMPGLHRTADDVADAGGSVYAAVKYESGSARWRRRYLSLHRDVARRLFPDGVPPE